MTTKNKYFRILFASVSLLLSLFFLNSCTSKKEPPNILFCIADDWGWPHAGAYGDSIVKTPTFDRLAAKGILFEQAYVSSPSCTPSRNAILTGQYHWRLKEGANLHSTLDVNIPVYPLLLKDAGYHIGYWRKSWGPGKLEVGGYEDIHPVGTEYENGFKDFLEKRPEGTPFCFWLGASDPHRSYEKGSGKLAGLNVDDISVPSFYPDVEEIRSDIADYYFEVERFDSDCGKAIKLLEEFGELENTIIVMTGDHGMPFPRCKSNLYDMGVRVPLAIYWGNDLTEKINVNSFVSLTDLAPTFLEAAGLDIPQEMTGKSLLSLIDPDNYDSYFNNRDFIIFGKERHVPGQLAPSIDGYPCRGIRTSDYLYIYNFRSDRWPAGVPEGSTHPMNYFPDCDNGPTKQFLIDNETNPKFKKFYELCFAKRPTEELYDVNSDPDQIINLANNIEYESIKKELKNRLMESLKQSKDPRVLDGGDIFDSYPYLVDYELREGS